jgi:hypothetical protein
MVRVIFKESFSFGDGYSFGKGECLISEAMAELLKGNRNVIFPDPVSKVEPMAFEIPKKKKK